MMTKMVKPSELKVGQYLQLNNAAHKIVSVSVGNGQTVVRIAENGKERGVVLGNRTPVWIEAPKAPMETLKPHQFMPVRGNYGASDY
jgi:translation elongation factor P/translation initiation factor 5A